MTPSLPALAVAGLVSFAITFMGRSRPRRRLCSCAHAAAVAGHGPPQPRRASASLQRHGCCRTAISNLSLRIVRAFAWRQARGEV